MMSKEAEAEVRMLCEEALDECPGEAAEAQKRAVQKVTEHPWLADLLIQMNTLPVFAVTLRERVTASEFEEWRKQLIRSAREGQLKGMVQRADAVFHGALCEGAGQKPIGDAYANAEFQALLQETCLDVAGTETGARVLWNTITSLHTGRPCPWPEEGSSEPVADWLKEWWLDGVPTCQEKSEEGGVMDLEETLKEMAETKAWEELVDEGLEKLGPDKEAVADWVTEQVTQGPEFFRRAAEEIVRKALVTRGKEEAQAELQEFLSGLQPWLDQWGSWAQESGDEGFILGVKLVRDLPDRVEAAFAGVRTEWLEDVANTIDRENDQE